MLDSNNPFLGTREKQNNFDYLRIRGDYARKNRERVFSAFLTIIVIGMLLFSSPVSSVIVKVEVDRSDKTYISGRNVGFMLQVDIQYATERIPFRNFTLVVTNSTGQTVKSCVFRLDGSAISGCDNINIGVLNAGPEFSPSGDMNFTDSLSYNLTNTSQSDIWQIANGTFGYGYGYGYHAGYDLDGLKGAEFKYNVSWDIGKEGLADGNYYANLIAFAENGIYAYKFKQSSNSDFKVDLTVPSITVNSIYDDKEEPYVSSSATPSINLTTSEGATCRYFNSNVLFAGMSDFTTTGGTEHLVTLPFLANGFYTYYFRCQDANGNEGSKSVDFTVLRVSRGVGGGVTTPKVILTEAVIEPGKPKTITLPLETSEKLGVTDIKIDVKNPVKDISIAVKHVPEKPANIAVTAGEKVYRYFEVTKTNIKDEDISKVKIGFKVEKSWMNENKVNANDILLKRFHNEVWQKLPTIQLKEDSKYVSFEAESEGFSTFAVVVEPKAVTTTTLPYQPKCGNKICETGENCGNCLEDCPCGKGYECRQDSCEIAAAKKYVSPILVIVMIFLIAVMVVWLIQVRAMRKAPEKRFIYKGKNLP